MSIKKLYINGCSFTAGDNLDEKDTWPFKLSILSKTELYNQAKNGQSFGSIFENTIFHLSQLDSKDTVVVIGMTWPHRHFFKYKGCNINITPADFDNSRLASKREDILPIYEAKRDYIKTLITHNPDYKQEMFNTFLIQTLALESFLIKNKFKYQFIGFHYDSGHLQQLRKNNKFDHSKLLYFDASPSDTMHPTAEDCTLISNKIYETIF